MSTQKSLWELPVLLLSTAALAACTAETRTFSTGGSGGHGGISTTASTSSGATCSKPADCPTAPNAQSECKDGVCSLACEPGFDDCTDEQPGCETPVGDDKQNCGACGVSCFLSCKEGACNDPVEIATGYRHACARLKDGSVFCWGGNQWGELGDGTQPPATEPRKVNLPGPATQIAAGGGTFAMPGGQFDGAHTCALLKDGTVQCWGNDDQRQLGLGVNSSNDPFPQPVVGLVNVEQIAAGGGHTCAINDSSQLLCWGSGSHGQIGDGGMGTVTQDPTVVLSPVAKVAAGLKHTCAIITDGTLYCWGDKYANMIGTQDGADNRVPNVVSGMIGPVDEVSLGKEHTCARSKNVLSCWGADYQSQTGLGDFTVVQFPKTVTVPDVRTFDLGPVFTGSVSGDNGEVRMWGYGPAGDGEFGDAQPRLTGLIGVEQISLGGHYGDHSFACALQKTGEILCWGRDAEGQLGDGPDNADKPMPVPVLWP